MSADWGTSTSEDSDSSRCRQEVCKNERNLQMRRVVAVAAALVFAGSVLVCRARDSATNFFRVLNDSERYRRGNTPVTAMFYYTNLEPDVLAYMRTLCVRTNIYENASIAVLHDMFRTLDTMPHELKPTATHPCADGGRPPVGASRRPAQRPALDRRGGIGSEIQGLEFAGMQLQG